MMPLLIILDFYTPTTNAHVGTAADVGDTDHAPDAPDAHVYAHHQLIHLSLSFVCAFIIDTSSAMFRR